MRQRAPRRAALAMSVAGALTAVAGMASPGVDAQVRATTRTTTAQSTPASASTLDRMEVRRARLDNGLRVVLNPDRTVPTIAIAVYYDVGSRNEERGRSGFAHLFEHMMFQGSANVQRGEHFALIMNRGGTLNGTTSEDRTNYFETLPSNELELGLFLESDRMRSLAITQSNFENQRIVVIQERQQSYENRPYAPSFLRIDELAYGSYWPYAHSTIGDTQDLVDAPLSAVQEFWDAYYAPNNAVIAIAGDFDPDEALERVRHYFGDIPSRTTPDYAPPEFTPQTAERTDTLVDALADVPAFHVSYHIPPSREDDHYALEMLATVLGDGESSRLYQELVKERELVTDFYVSTADRRGPDTFNVFALLAEGHTGEEVRPYIYAAIDRIAQRGVTARELEKVRNRMRAAFVFGLQSNMDRARNLAEFELYWGDAALLAQELPRYLAVTSEDLSRVARQYFTAANRTVLDVVPASASAGGAP